MDIRNHTQILSGWTLTIDEVSNNVYKVTLTDNFGRQCATTDTDLDAAIATCENYAFDIERQISKNWVKFLYKTCLIKFAEKAIKENHYHEEAFGSWYILLKDRILYDGRDFIFCIQVYNDNEWVDIERIKTTDLTYEKFITAINKVR